MYYKATVPERGQDATVTVKHEGNETVVLKSRASPKSMFLRFVILCYTLHTIIMKIRNVSSCTAVFSWLD